MNDRYRIAIIMLTKGPLHEYILDGFYSHIKRHAGEVITREFTRETVPPGASLEALLDDATIEDCELAITLGASVSNLTAQRFQSKKYPIPIVFAGVFQNISDHLAAAFPFVTGVATEPPEEYLPVQALLRTLPNAKHFILPYRKMAKLGRMEYDAEQIAHYFSDRGIRVTKIPLDNNDGPSIILQKINPYILSQEVDAIIIPETGLTTNDVKILEELSTKSGIILFGDGQTQTKAFGVYGYPRDFHFTGAKVAEIAGQVLSGTSPHEICPYVVKNSRSLNVNTQAMAKTGVFLADDVVASFDGVLDTKDLPTYPIGHMISTENSLWYGLLISVGQRFQKESTACYIPTNYIGWPGNTEFLRRQATELLTNIKRYDYSHLLFYGGEQAATLWQIAKENNESLPPLLIITIDGQDDLAWCTTARAHGCIITVLTIPPRFRAAAA